MKHVLAILAVTVLAACQTQPQEPITPYGAYAATLDPECATSPACVCSLSIADRPATLTNPITGEAMPYECADD